jgi:hypothetical protein
MAWYCPLVLMSSSMPDRRRVSLAAVNTAAQATWGEPASGVVSKYLTSKTRSVNFQPSGVRR